MCAVSKTSSAFTREKKTCVYKRTVRNCVLIIKNARCPSCPNCAQHHQHLLHPRPRSEAPKLESSGSIKPRGSQASGASSSKAKQDVHYYLYLHLHLGPTICALILHETWRGALHRSYWCWDEGYSCLVTIVLPMACTSVTDSTWQVAQTAN